MFSTMFFDPRPISVFDSTSYNVIDATVTNVTDLELSGDGNTLIYCDNVAEVASIYVKDGSWTETVLSPYLSNVPESVSINTDGSRYIIGFPGHDGGSTDIGVVKNYGTTTNALIGTGTNSSFVGTDVAMSGNGNYIIASGAVNGAGKVWVWFHNGSSWSLQQTITGPGNSPYMSINNDGDWFASGQNWTRSGTVWSSFAQQSIGTVITPDGSRMVGYNNPGKIEIYSDPLATGTWTLEYTKDLPAAIFNPEITTSLDGNIIAVRNFSSVYFINVSADSIQTVTDLGSIGDLSDDGLTYVAFTPNGLIELSNLVYTY